MPSVVRNKMEQSLNSSYPLKTWLFTILVSPFLFILILGIYNSSTLSQIIESIPLLFYMNVFGLVLSLPSLFLFWLLFKELKSSSRSIWLKKLLLSLVGIVFIWITFYLLDRKYFSEVDFQTLMWPGIYSITLPIGVFLFKFNTLNHSKTQTEKHR
jgi:hypothetical protein